ncbi:Uma2 family endonuclease [Methylotuvimicrobium sp.]|uniref:Uma2 family endonuclease n=1 Tax=Methylotuvimicrobium sp. TaxID=2822413 RepID=UPI003D66169B
MALNVAIKQGISEEDYLLGELSSEIKHELIDGVAYAMAGASKDHERIAGNIFVLLHVHLQNHSCEPFASDVKVKVNEDFFYPDVMVVCEDRSENPYYTDSPTVLVEVLSSSTRRMDQTIKRMAYQSIPSLQELVLIEQDFVDVEVCRRSKNWLSRHYFLGDEFVLESIGLTLSVADIYRRVQNPDMLAYLQQQELS